MKLYFAPMEGITGYVFRNAYAACYGGIDTYFTPFLSNSSLNHIEHADVLPEHNEGLQVVPQILTNRSKIFVMIANTMKDFGYREVNLNLGCPSGTVVAKKRGAGALREPKELDRLLGEIYDQSPLPVSVKCRIGISSENEWEDIREVLLKYPMTELIIHPRLQKEFYKGKVHMDAFRTAYQRITEIIDAKGHGEPSLRLCYNGDIRTLEDAKRLAKEFPKLSALMLGRGLLWNPGLIRPLSAYFAEEDTIAREEITEEPYDRETFRHFLDLLYEGYRAEMDREGPALMKLKELWAYMKVYAGLSDAAMRPLWKTKTLAEYRDVVNMLLR